MELQRLSDGLGHSSSPQAGLRCRRRFGHVYVVRKSSKGELTARRQITNLGWLEPIARPHTHVNALATKSMTGAGVKCMGLARRVPCVSRLDRFRQVLNGTPRRCTDN